MKPRFSDYCDYISHLFSMFSNIIVWIVYDSKKKINVCKTHFWVRTCLNYLLSFLFLEPSFFLRYPLPISFYPLWHFHLKWIIPFIFPIGTRLTRYPIYFNFNYVNWFMILVTSKHYFLCILAINIYFITYITPFLS